jgi:hypothetical protein
VFAAIGPWLQGHRGGGNGEVVSIGFGVPPPEQRAELAVPGRGRGSRIAGTGSNRKGLDSICRDSPPSNGG